MKFLVAALALALITGCVYQPISVEVYTITAVENADIGIDASRTTTQDTYHEARQ